MKPRKSVGESLRRLSFILGAVAAAMLLAPMSPFAGAGASQAALPAGAEQTLLDKQVLVRWGFEALNQIEKDLSQTGSALYAEYGTPDGKRGGDHDRYSFIWPAGFQLRALAAAARGQPQRFRKPLIRFADALDQYWTVRHGMGGYMVLPGDSERFYDDNAWIVLGMIETFEATRQPKYLKRAADTLAFIASGEKKTPGGGIRQHEDKAGKTSVCTTAPAIVGALRLHRATKNRKFLEMAERWHTWLTSKEVGIKDPQDGLFDDQAGYADGKWEIVRGKRAYNSALPLQANVLFYQIKKDPAYLKEAQRMADAALARWVLPSGTLKETAQWGGSDLCDALLDLYDADKNPRWPAAVHRMLEFLHEKGRDPNGRYGEYWHEDRRKSPLPKFFLLHMAPAARAYWRAAASAAGSTRPRGMEQRGN